MATKSHHLHDSHGGAALAIRVTPRAKHNQISEIRPDGTVKIRLTAPPVDGKANQALIDYLAEILDIPRFKIEIVAGQTGRDKLVSILDLDPETVQTRLLAEIK